MVPRRHSSLLCPGIRVRDSTCHGSARCPHWCLHCAALTGASTRDTALQRSVLQTAVALGPQACGLQQRTASTFALLCTTPGMLFYGGLLLKKFGKQWIREEALKESPPPHSEGCEVIISLWF